MRVYFTIDTETSMGGAWHNPFYSPLPVDGPIFGTCGSAQYGLPLIMDILEEHNFRATFFTEVFCSYILGDEQVARVFRYIQKRGHDTQLHLHPIYRFYRDAKAGGPRREIDLMFQLSAEEQTAFIAEGVSLFRSFTGKEPRAYRAGCYGAAESTLRALRANGIVIDSSYNQAFRKQTCGFERPRLNAPVLMEGVYEFPVTVFHVPWEGYKPLEISSVSVGEIMTTIRALQQGGCSDAVLVLHSFSLLKNAGVRYETSRPDHILIDRFRKLCAAIAELHGEIEVTVMGELDLHRIALDQPQLIPDAGWIEPAMRKLIQGVNRLPWV